MNRSTKVSLVSAIFALTGLCGSLSYAAPDVNNNSIHSIVAKQNIDMSNNAKQVAYNYAFSRIPTKTSVSRNKASRSALSKTSQQPLHGIKVTDFAHIVPNSLHKKNTLFEFAARFNDKLQQILTIFDFSPTSTYTNKEQSTHKSQQSNVHLTRHIGNCASSKK